MSFTLRFAAVLGAGVAAAVVLSPFVAVAVAAIGFHFPFPRIFDRVVMAALFAAILVNARGLGLFERLARGFAESRGSLIRALRGLVVGIAGIGALWAVASIAVGGGTAGIMAVLVRGLKYLPAAILIAVMEEGFFRAFLLDGMETDFGKTGAVAASAGIYALAHLIRSPARFYVSNLEPLAGARNLLASLAQLSDPRVAPTALLGLFIVGLVLGEAFVLTGTVYFSIGMHTGLIIGLKSWPEMVTDRAALPWWLFGHGRFALVSGVAAWAVGLAILVMIRPLALGRDSAKGHPRQDRAPSPG